MKKNQSTQKVLKLASRLEKELVAKNRALEIESALENVRARTMAMQKSNELPEISFAIFHQLKKLGEPAEQLTIGVVNELKQVVKVSATFRGSKMQQQYEHPIDEPLVMSKIYKSWKRKKKSLIVVLKGTELRAYNKFRNKLTGTKKFSTLVKSTDRRLLYVAFYSKGMIGLATDNNERPKESIRILERFALVFDQAYTRFLDLQKAEEQATESQIQLALERVRARTMAMQKSSELAETAVLLFEQLKLLGVDLRGCGFNIWEKNNKTCTAWMSSPEGTIMPPFTLPLTEDPLFIRYYQSRQKGEDFWVQDIAKKELVARFRYLKTLPGLGELLAKDSKDDLEVPEFMVDHVVNFSHGNLIFITYKHCREAWDIFKRFGKVFEQTYTRFLDLQKAEAQAREAQIEAALEKVRSRSLAVQKSDEFNGVIKVVFERLRDLGILVNSTSINIRIDGSKDFDVFACGESDSGLTTIHYRLPYFDHPVFQDLINAFETATDFFSRACSREEKDSFYKYVLAHSDLKNLPNEIKNKILESNSYTVSSALAKNSMIVVNDFEGKHLSASEIDILKRFSRVFEQAYTRFLDLQRAEAQAREAQIEASLERVRAKTMAMHNSQDVGETVITLLGEFARLGIETFRCGIGIIHPTKEMEVWTARPNDVGKPEWFTGRLDMTIHALLQGAYSSWENKEQAYSYDLKGDDLVDYFTSINNLPNYSLKYNIPSLPPRLVHSEFYFPEGAVFAFSREPLSAESSQIFQRFSAVFRQTYRRFLDLQKAEAQAREGQIQLGLERVRSRAMAMQSSEELTGLIGTVFTELTKLDLVLTRCIIWVFDSTTNDARWWMANGEEPSNPLSFYLKYHEHPAYLTFVKGWKSQNVKFVYDLKGQDKINWDNILFNETELKNLPDVVKDGMRTPERVLLSASFNNFGGINVASLEPLSDEQFEILLRFAKVFDLTYTRFLDLQKAEAQAREAQIQLALERVRARTMAMQKSDELPQAANLLFQQVQSLGMPAWSAGYCIWDEDKQAITLWMSTEGTLQPPFRASLTEDPSFIHMREADERGESFFVEEIGGDDLVKHYQYMRTLPEVGAIIDSVIESSHPLPTFQIFHLSYFTYGFLLFITYEPVPEAHDIFRRIGKVFDQTYTRFLDLQKAEAQAREAEIQLALERVRARTMAMQHSDELKTAATLLFQQAKALGVPAYSCGYNIWEQSDSVFTSWMSTQDGTDINAVYDIPLTEDANFIRFAESRRKGEQFFVLELRGERMQEHYQYLKTIPAFRAYFDYAIEAGFPLPETQIHHIANFSNGNLLFITLQPCPEFHDVFKRFASVFDQTYTRFLDLQKAEAQAREAQIEASLERVRSKTMAMHNSNDVEETVAAMFAEFVHLGITTNRCGILILNDEYYAEVWTARSAGEGKAELIIGKLDLAMHQMLSSVARAWKAKKQFFQYELVGDDLIQYYMAINNARFYPTQFDLNALPPREFHSDFFFEDGAVSSFTNEPVAEEHAKIMRRFASVFGQTYRRYLDLQKAEAQAREAQIEAALERVRSRTMGMHNSNDLTEAASALFTEMNKLGVNPMRTGFVLLTKDSRRGKIYHATSFDNKTTVLLTGESDYVGHPIYEKQYESWQSKEDYFPVLENEEELRSFYKVLRDHLSPFYENVPTDKKQYGNILPFSEGFLFAWSERSYSEKEINILNRLKSILDLTIRRYLDLKKAEAQVREAQIEAALERVRSRTMGMQKSEELKEVIQLVYGQFAHLNIHVEHTGFILDYKTRDDLHIWLADQHLVPSEVVIPWFDSPPNNSIKEAKEKGQDFFAYLLAFEEKNKFYRDLFKFIPEVPEETLEYYFNCAGLAGSGVLLENVGLYIENFSGIPYSDEENATLMRFGKVFQQTYTRFLDLQKAEAQVRESQIQLALERARAQSMMMQHSKELDDTLHVFHEQVLQLKIPSAFSFLWLPNEEEDRHIFWAAWVEDNSFKSKAINYPLDRNEPATAQCLVDWKSNVPVVSYHVPPEDVASYFAAWSELIAGVEELQPQYFNDGLYYVEAFMKYGCFGVMVKHSLNEDEKKILERFAVEFERAYTRFLDLQKAEEQARESQIEAALERVRSRSLAMHHTSEIQEVIHSVHEELLKLDVSILGGSFIVINKDIDDKLYVWGSGGTADTATKILVPDFNMRFCTNIITGIKKGPGFFTEEFSREEKIKYFTELFRHEPWSAISPEQQNAVLESKGKYTRSVSVSNHTSIFIINQNGRKFTEEENEILKRFSKVFEQAYVRFLDLQKAEAQARESQIQLALERVRARTMAMQKSDELSETAQILFQQFRDLGESPIQITIGIVNESKGVIEFSVTHWGGGGAQVHRHFNVDIQEPTLINKIYAAWKEQKKSLVVDLSGNELDRWLDYRNAISGVTVNSNDTQGRRVITSAFFSKGHLTFSAPEPRPQETVEILERFASTFDLTYTRFLDLKKAEAQAREAQIEAALEKVRARSLAMHKSDELLDASSVLFHEIKRLGIPTTRSGFGIYDEKEEVIRLWMTATAKAGEASDRPVSGNIPLRAHPAIFKNYEGWKQKKTMLIQEFNGKQVNDYYQSISGYLSLTLEERYPERLVFSVFFFKEGSLNVMSDKQLTEEEQNIILRFANVFGFAFTRFLDLQKAEAQARESQIEAALERVRAKAMAMQNSNDLSIAASMVFSELRKLGIQPIRCGVGLLTKESRKAQLYSATSSADGDSLSLVGWVMLSGHPVLQEIYDSWMKNEDSFPVLEGEQLKLYYEKLLEGLSLPNLPDWQPGQKQYGHFLQFSIGCLYAWSETQYNDDEVNILKRFASIIDLTFRRYMELQQSESNAREAIKQAALDRVRADIASMRTVSDLDRITPLIWNELTILGIPFIRCGVFIMDDAQQLIHTFLSTPDGKAIAAFHIPYDTSGNIGQIVTHWHNKKEYIDHWDESAFKEFATTLVKQRALVSPEQYLKTIPHGGFYLHFLPFLQGMLYVGNTNRLGNEEIQLLQSVADAFSTAYARYEDFNKLEAAKQQVEKTLVDLKQAQTQLVQSEKMASLGELTAGIAHEIQNPLNFVNNFSDVSSELLDEMKNELEHGNSKDAAALVEDVKQNLEKILYHGKRADAIVKGMLQHSRTSSGQKELTDINGLCDEYLRLAYHGLRAKDKSFNAKFETDFDNSIGKLDVIPQDIGRVILNLINNAFYAVTEKRKQSLNGYEPRVKVTTRREPGCIEIKVSDNGNGIPSKLLDKIFQPFFTTKPTGQGTGLGLSLAYDIVTKGHGGDLKVETKEGEGSEFIMQLPLS